MYSSKQESGMLGKLLDISKQQGEGSLLGQLGGMLDGDH